MADNKDRQRQRRQQQEQQQTTTKMKALLTLPRGYSSFSHSPNPNPRNARVGGIGGGGIGDEEEDGEDEVAPLTSSSPLAHGRTVTTTTNFGSLDPPSSSSPASNPNCFNSKHSKKRKLTDVCPTRGGANGTPAMDDRSAPLGSHEKDKQNQSSELTGSIPGTPSELQSVLSMPDKKVLFAAIDKFQKKDTYGVFSEPVDPEELPDYFDVIENPMDFGTIRKKLERGDYVSLDQLEKDVLLVCSNAMSYNASSTVYYRQARSIQELARKTFQSLRCDPEGFEVERERKPVVKIKSGPSFKRSSRRASWGRSRFESGRSDFVSGATLASSGDHADWSSASPYDPMKIRKGTATERPSGYFDVTDVNSPAEVSEELSGSILKGTALRDGKRDLLIDENRRGTYKPWNMLMSGNESIFAIFGENPKQLVHNGIQSEHAYARSLARFSVDLGPVAWKIAAKKIEKSLCSNVPFGQGWVGKDEAPPGALLLPEEIKDQQTLAQTSTVSSDFTATKDKLNLCAANQATNNQASTPSSVATVAQSTGLVPLSQYTGLPVPLSMSSQSANNTNFQTPLQGVKQSELKSASSIAKSSEVNLAGAKFTSDVSQSKLLEIVSRSNRLMQWTSTKPAEHVQPVSSVQTTTSGSTGFDRRLDGNSNCVAREPYGDTKLSGISSSVHVALSSVEPSIPNYQDKYRAVWTPPSTSSQEYGTQDLNWLVNSAQGKMPGLQQRPSNMPINTQMLGFSSVPSRQTTVSRGDVVAEAWVQSRATDLAHADGSPRIKMQTMPDAYYNMQQTQARPSSSVPQFIQQQAPMDTSLYMRSQLSWMHPQNLSSHATSQGGLNSMVELPNSTTQSPFNYRQIPMGADTSQSQKQLWQSLPSKQPSQQTSEFSNSIPPDLNVGFQSPRSPVRQSSGMMVDSQPDLALQL